MGDGRGCTAGSAGVYASVAFRYGLGAWSWVFAAAVLVLLVGCTLAAGVMMRQPGIALPGSPAACSSPWPGWCRTGSPLRAHRRRVPVVGGAGAGFGGAAAGGGGGHAVGWQRRRPPRIARLAGFSAGLGMFLYGTLAVAVIGAAGAQIDANWTVSANVDDRLGNNVIFYLWVLPLITAALGWAAAAATARIRPRLAVSVAAVPSTVSGQVGRRGPCPGSSVAASGGTGGPRTKLAPDHVSPAAVRRRGGRFVRAGPWHAQ